jgi:membrane-associated phospholipid phosphatase
MKSKHKVAKPKQIGRADKPIAAIPPDIELPDAHKERRWLWGIGSLIGLVLFGGGALVALQHIIPAWEERLFRLINSWPEGLYHFFLVGTIAPESLWIAVAAVAVTFFLKLYRLSWQLAAATVAGYVLTYAAKKLIVRPRPMEFYHDIHIRINENGMGFPSGHTMIITVVVLTLFPYLPRGFRWSVLLLIPLVGLSRVYLGVHAPLDVVGGFALGLCVVSAMRLIPGKLRDIVRFD